LAPSPEPALVTKKLILFCCAGAAKENANTAADEISNSRNLAGIYASRK
jgi:hypothetical protein